MSSRDVFIFQGLLESQFNWLPVPKSKGKASIFTALLVQVVTRIGEWLFPRSGGTTRPPKVCQVLRPAPATFFLALSS